MIMETMTSVIDRKQIPFLDQKEIPVVRMDTRLEQGLVNDPDVLEFLETHPKELEDSTLDTRTINRMNPNKAVVYKILHHEYKAPEELAGLIYLIRDIEDPQTLQLLYLLGKKHQDKKIGIATEAVAALTDEIGKEYNLAADIDDMNYRSKRLALALGFVAQQDVNGKRTFDGTEDFTVGSELYYRFKQPQGTKHKA